MHAHTHTHACTHAHASKSTHMYVIATPTLPVVDPIWSVLIQEVPRVLLVQFLNDYITHFHHLRVLTPVLGPQQLLFPQVHTTLTTEDNKGLYTPPSLQRTTKDCTHPHYRGEQRTVHTTLTTEDNKGLYTPPSLQRTTKDCTHPHYRGQQRTVHTLTT